MVNMTCLFPISIRDPGHNLKIGPSADKINVRTTSFLFLGNNSRNKISNKYLGYISGDEVAKWVTTGLVHFCSWSVLVTRGDTWSIREPGTSRGCLMSDCRHRARSAMRLLYL